MNGLSPEQKRALIRRSFEAKIRTLWEWAERGTPEGATIPKTRTALRRWKDEEAGLLPWSDDAVDSPNGKNADLAREFEKALEAIRKRASKSKTARLSEAEGEVIVLKARVEALLTQNAELIGRVASLELRNQQLQDRLDARVASGGEV